MDIYLIRPLHIKRPLASAKITQMNLKRDFVLPRNPNRASSRFDQTRILFFYFVCVPLLLSSVVRAQESPSNPLEEAQKAKPAETVPTGRQVAPAESPGLQEAHARLFWIIPPYRVSNSKAPVSMSSPEKFRLFARNTIDPFTISYTAFTAGIKQADNKLSGYGQGAAGLWSAKIAYAVSNQRLKDPFGVLRPEFDKWFRHLALIQIQAAIDALDNDEQEIAPDQRGRWRGVRVSTVEYAAIHVRPVQGSTSYRKHGLAYPWQPPSNY